MKFKLLQKTELNFLSIFFIILCFGCTSQNSTQEITEDYSTVKIHEETELISQKRNKTKLEGLLIKNADSFYFANNFKQAQTLYDMALNNVTDAETKKYLLQKIADTKGKIKEKTVQDSIESDVKK